MSDNFTEVTSQSWFSRIGGAFKGIITGVILICIAFPLLFWNEGRAVRTYKTLKEGSRTVVSVAVDRVDAGNEGKLIHVRGTAATDEVLVDPVFGVSANALKLKRVVEFYQWKESKESRTEKKLGGSSETVTTYSYEKVWSKDPIDSSKFKQPTGHENTTAVAFDSTIITAQKVALGAFRLSQSLLGKVNTFAALSVAADTKIPEAIKDKVKWSTTGFYAGKESAAPQIGDARITFMTVAAPTEVSVVAEQVGSTFEPYAAKTGGTVELLQTGMHSAEEMFQSAQSQNTMITWFLRVLGFLFMLFGFAAILKPLSVLADVVPLFGTIVETSTGIIAFLIAAPLTLITVAIAWIVYRPLLGIGLLVVAAGVAVLLRKELKKPAVLAAQLKSALTHGAEAAVSAIKVPPVTSIPGPVPYGIDKRPPPADDNLDTLAPQQVGPFQRGKVEDSDHWPGTRCRYVDYAMPGTAKPNICIGIFVHASPAEAQRSQKGQCVEDPEHGDHQYSFDTDPSFYRDPDYAEGGYFYFTRGRFGFLVQAWNGEQDLDAFMTAFPY